MHTIWIESDLQSVRESPLALRAPQGAAGRERLGPMELRAEGHVVIEGRDAQRGLFTARGQTATYDQIKTMFVLEGGANGPARVTHQQYVGALASESTGRKLIYWQKTGDVEVVDATLQYRDFDAGRPADLQRK